MYCVYANLGSTTELHKLVILICLLKTIPVSLFDEMAKKPGILFQNNDLVHEASDFIIICLNDFFPSV